MREETLTQRTDTGAAPVGEAFALLVSSATSASLCALPDGPEVLLGRCVDAGVMVDDPSVSRSHAVLRVRGELSVEDCGSTNGTRLNGVRLRPGVRAPIAIGAVLELGSAVVILQRGRHPSAPVARARSRETLHADAEGEAPVVEDVAMKRLHALVDVVAASPLSVVLSGETGVGKEVFAAAIHRRSPRAAMPFLAINCAALPDSVLEAELFGYEKGAFTGAVQGRPGFFESASGGTLFLDELGDLPRATQPKLLRVLQSGEVLRLGSRRAVRTDVRIVAASNRDLRAMVASGEFRADLFFRVNGITLTIPPLRQRPDDIPALARRFLSSACARMGKPEACLATGAARALEAFDWPGNVRELKSVMERAATLCQGTSLGLEELYEAAPELRGAAHATGAPPSSAPSITGIRPVARADGAGGDACERERIVLALGTSHGNQKRAAEALGISRRTLLNKLDSYGIGRPRKAT
jgi:two-component system response regulator AtoC